MKSPTLLSLEQQLREELKKTTIDGKIVATILHQIRMEKLRKNKFKVDIV